MKKLTAMLLSLVMCFSLLAIPAQAASDPTPTEPGIIGVGGPKGPADPGDKDPEEPGDEDPEEPGAQIQRSFPRDREEVPIED